jgi:hypothetical protein
VAKQHDLLIQAIATFESQKKASTWIVFAFQMFVDMHRELGTGVERAFEELIEIRIKMITTLERFIHCQRNCSEKMGLDWYKAYRDRLAGWIDCVKGFEQSKGNSAIESAFSMVLKPVDEERYYKDQPVSCGYFLKATLSNLHLLGVDCAAHLERVMLVCHLYNAGFQLDLLRPRVRWPDLGHVIEQQGEAKIYSGGLPRTLEDCLKRLNLALSHKPSSDAQYNRQCNNATVPQKNKRSKKHLGDHILLVTSPDDGR